MNLSVISSLLGGVVIGGLIGYGAATKMGSGKTTAGLNESASVTGSPVCSAGGSEASGVSDGLFVLDGKTYSRSDLPDSLRANIYEIEHEQFEGVSGVIKSFAVQLAMARSKDAKVSSNKLPPIEELLGAITISDTQANDFFEKNKNRMPPNAKYEELKDKIKEHMMGEARSEKLREKMAELEKDGRLKLVAKEPEAPTVNIDTKNYPATGPQDAKVVLIEISDYQCPHCQRTQPEIDSLLKNNSGKFKFVQINFALNPEGLSGVLARGAYCANQQGSDKFWTYHSAAFQVKPDEKADVALKRLAQLASLDAAKLTSCVASEEAKAYVKQTAKSMSAAGITGTPTFILNNKRLGHGSVSEALTAALK